jgi:phosphorylase/glycogen(starch) synthase
MRTASRQAQPAFLYVVSWEVCNRLGGVHTVLETSAPHLRAFSYGEEMLYIGPDLWADRAAQAAFAEDPTQPEIAAIAAERDVPVRFGRWNIPGQPPCALVDFGRMLERRNAILGDLWNQFGVDSIHADWDTVEQILFGYAAGKLIELHYHTSVRPRARRAVAHFHQWKSAAGILRLSVTTPEIATVYTPHGTALGRKLASDGVPLHTDLKTIDAAAAARERRIEAPHTLERAAAREAAILACVSEHEGEEAAHMLDRRPDLITPNGFTPPPRPERPREEIRAALCKTVERFLGSPVDPAATRIALSSGRYEFRNKGIDLMIRALGKLRARTPPPPRPLLFLLFVAAPQTGPRPEALKRCRETEPIGEPCGVCTHNLAHPEKDEVMEACRAAGLENRPGDPVRFVFAPILLDGRDPIFPFSYPEVLQACDLSIFPSRYEPWGLTPLESLAAHVPTITTDLTGFGRFVATLPQEECSAVTVLPSAAATDAQLAESLEAEILRFLERSDESLLALRRCGDDVVRRTSWDQMIAKLEEAHRLALERTEERAGTGSPTAISRLSTRSVVVIPARSESRPQLYRFSVSAALPARIGRLAELARNVWWSWNASGRAIFDRLAERPILELGDNPVQLLRSLDPQSLSAFARSKEFLAAYDAVMAEFDAYRARPPADAPATAYFCAEFAVHPTLPIYSGGLGVLAGDHLKSASDLALPLIGVGLRYSDGYFHQHITPDGRQGVEYVAMDPRESPIAEVTEADGTPLRISIAMPERELKAGVWRVDVGSVPLYLLDTQISENDRPTATRRAASTPRTASRASGRRSSSAWGDGGCSGRSGRRRASAT